MTVTLQTFFGNHHEIGVQQGRAVRASMHGLLKRLPNLETMEQVKPRLLPTALFLRLARRRVAKLLRDDLFRFYPRQAEHLKGLAEGAGIDMETAFFLQSLEWFICTSLGFGPQRTMTGETIVAKNFDYRNELAPLHLTCLTKPSEGLQTLGCTMAPLPGMLDGMSECGLSVPYNLAYTIDKPTYHVPLSLVVREMLETCRSTDEAVEYITKAKRAARALLMIADAKGETKTVEISSNHAAIRKMIDSQIINTNHYHTPEMQKHERTLSESSTERLKRAQELLGDKEKIDEKKIITVLRDHGKDNKPSSLTICRHATPTSTLRSVIFYPDRKTIKVLYGKPCQNEYSQFTF